MIVDTSALVAIAMGEPDARRLLTILRDSPTARISAANLLETYMVIERRRGSLAEGTIAEGIVPVGLVVEPVTEGHVDIARAAFAQYGKGSGHAARLNFGDCFAYALSRYLDEPLLFIGNDFAQRISPQQGRCLVA